MSLYQIRKRDESHDRWAKAVERAAQENIRVCQLQGSGQWIATSGSQSAVAYEVQVTGNVAHDCDCLAGLNGDPVCKHRAAFYLLIGALAFSTQPNPPTHRECPVCHGCGVLYDPELERLGMLYPTCRVCGGTGIEKAPTLRPVA